MYRKQNPRQHSKVPALQGLMCRETHTPRTIRAAARGQAVLSARHTSRFISSHFTDGKTEAQSVKGLAWLGKLINKPVKQTVCPTVKKQAGKRRMGEGLRF